ncbi:hypothetical protein Tco_0010704 [Tanacetum coccineum]
MISSKTQVHNDIMAAGSKERPPMLAPGSYAQWQSRFLRYVDLKPNKKLLRKCIFEGPYELAEIKTPTVPADGDNPTQDNIIQEEIYENTTLEKQALIDAEAEAVHMIMNGIGEFIYIHNVYTKLFWEFAKFTSRDGETIESYYRRFYRMMNEMQTSDLDTISYHKLFDILKQYQNEVNDIRAERKAKNANLLTLIEVITASDNNSGPTYDTEPLEKNAKEQEDEHVLLASLIANLKLDVDDDKKIHKQLKKANTSLT